MAPENEKIERLNAPSKFNQGWKKLFEGIGVNRTNPIFLGSNNPEDHFASFMVRANRETFVENGVKPEIYECLFPNNVNSAVNMHIALSETFPQTVIVTGKSLNNPYCSPSITIARIYYATLNNSTSDSHRQRFEVHRTIECNPAGKNISDISIKPADHFSRSPIGFDFLYLEVAGESDCLAILKTVEALAKQEGLIKQ